MCNLALSDAESSIFQALFNGSGCRFRPIISTDGVVMLTMLPRFSSPYAHYSLVARSQSLQRYFAENSSWEDDLEGIVAKRKDGLYTPDETTWVTSK